MLHAKFDGCCALCGEQLGPRWCIWNIEPTNTVVNYKGEIILGDESYENKLPACKSCNGTRVHWSWVRNTLQDTGKRINIEEFRSLLQFEYEFLQGQIAYKKMIRFGLIRETGKPIVFHFEKFQ